jgi:alpha-L-fucosidase
MKIGFYYSSLLDWSFTWKPITSLAELVASSPTSLRYINYVEKHWLELIERYDPWILWSDIGYPPGYDLPKLWAHFYNRKPEGVINDRWVQVPKIFFNRPGRYFLSRILKRLEANELPKPPHYDFITPEYATLDHIATSKWETCRGIGNSFGYNQFEDANNYQSADDLIRLLADIVSKNGNLLLNVGPCPDGSIHPMQVQALEGLGAWLQRNGEAIYGTRPWIRYTDSDPGSTEVRYTARKGTLYVIVTKLPQNRMISLPREVSQGYVTLLETGEQVQLSENKLSISLPEANSIPVIKIQS